jgi:hypothetical protein
MSEREYILSLDINARIRCYHRTESGIVTGFMVQLEFQAENTWRPIIRYDTAHGFAHCDRHRKDGTVTKTALTLAFSEASTFAELDIRRRWKEYIRMFLEEQR